jgi:hypothetical protein
MPGSGTAQASFFARAIRATAFAALSLAPISLAASSLSAGCATHEQELLRAEQHYGHDEHELALATLRALEPDWTALSMRDRARYAYLRGMTGYRSGFKADARHWLLIASQIDRENPGALYQAERTTADEKIAELNEVVWAGDVLPSDEAPGAVSPRRAPERAPKPEAPAGDAETP